MLDLNLWKFNKEISFRPDRLNNNVHLIKFYDENDELIEYWINAKI